MDGRYQRLGRWILAIVFGFGVITAIAEKVTNRGKEFYFTFLPNYHNALLYGQPTMPGDSLLLFFYGAEQRTWVKIEATDFNGQMTPLWIALEPGEVQRVSFPAYLYELRGDNWGSYPYPKSQNRRIVRTGFHILAEHEIAVVGVNRALWTTDALLFYPVEALGTEYVVLSYPSDGRVGQGGLDESSTPSQFVVVATAPDTQVQIVPNVPSADTMKLLLDAGEVYLLQAKMEGNLRADLTGTRILSDKPVAVFAGHQRATVPISLRAYPGSPSRDMLLAQLLPVDLWSKEALLFPFLDPIDIQPYEEDVYRVVATMDGTRLFANGEFLATLRAGQVFEAPLRKPLHLVANKPIQVAQFKSTANVEGAISARSDPFFLQIPGPEQFDTSYFVVVPQLYDGEEEEVMEELYIVVVQPVGTTVNFFPLPQGTITMPQQIGNSGYEYVTYRVAPGNYQIWAEQPFGVFIYAYGKVESYGYVGGSQAVPLVDRAPPLLVTEQQCLEIRGWAIDTGRIRSGIAALSPVSGYCENVTVTTQILHPDTLAFVARLNNIFDDGFCYVTASDSAHWTTQAILRIPGMTVHIAPQLRMDTAVRVQWDIPGNRFVCYPFRLVNYGKFPQRIDSCRLRNFADLFVVPDTAILLDTGAARMLQLCVRQPISDPMVIVDTLDIYQPCGKRQVLAFVITVQSDTAAPDISAERLACDTALRFVAVDPLPYRSGIAAYGTQLRNAEVTAVQWMGSDTLLLQVRLLDPYQDAIVGVWVEDSSGNRREIRDTIQGFTLRWVAASVPDTVKVGLGQFTCFTVQVQNVGILPFVLDENVGVLRNFSITIPRAQFPMVIAPSERKALTVCVALNTDTVLFEQLLLSFRCLQQTLPLILASVPQVQWQQNRCGVSVRLLTTTVTRKGFWISKPYPSPTTGEAVLQLNSALSGNYELHLYNLLGQQVGRFSLALAAGRYALRLDLRQLPAGKYFGVLIHRSSGAVRTFQLERF